MTLLDLTALLGLGLGAATFLLYPLAIACLASAARPRPIPRGDGAWPSVSILIAAHAEEAVIEEKLRSVADSDYPGPVECLLGDDGSPDGTLDAARRAAWPGLRVMAYPRAGKSAVLARLVDAAEGDLLVFTDADPLFRPDTLRELARPFADPGVGAVAGVVAVADAGGGDGLFRRYENAIRRAEDRLFGLVSADGGIYAVRRALYRQPPEGVTDDFYISTEAVARGYRIAFAPKAKVVERPVERTRALFSRRTRITVRGLASVAARRELLSVRRYGGYAVGFFFHKVMRRLAPPAVCVGAVAGSAAMAWRAVLLAGPAALAVLILAAIAMLVTLVSPRRPRPVALCLYVGTGLAAMSWGLVLFLLGRRPVSWTPVHAAEPTS